MKYAANTYYMTVEEKFIDQNGERSIYDRLMTGGFTCSIAESWEKVTKEILKERAEKRLSGHHVDLSDFKVSEMENGWKYERFVKWLDEDGFKYELVEEGQHTDHETYLIEIFYIDLDTNPFKRLRT